MKIVQASTFSYDRIDKYISQGHPFFSVSRFGYEYLKKLYGSDNYKVITPENSIFLPFIEKILGNEGRNIVLQVRCAFYKHADVIYYPTDRHIWLLSLLRKFRVCKKPILVVSHFTYNTHHVNSKFKKILLRIERFIVFHSIDQIVFANENLLKHAMKDYRVPLRHQKYTGWGADLDFFSLKEESTPDIFFLAAGGVNRDYDTLIKAFSVLPYKLVISCSPTSLQRFGDLPPNIEVFDYKKYGMAASEKLRQLYYQCYAVLISIEQQNHVPNGASVLVESLACGKPIVITDYDSNYIDVESDRCGYLAKHHNPKDWVDKIEELLIPERYLELKNNCISLAKEKYNYKIFSQDIFRMINDMVVNGNHV